MNTNTLINSVIKENSDIKNDLAIYSYLKIKNLAIPEWEEAFNSLTLQDCIDYIHNLTINCNFDGYTREKSVVNDSLAKIFPLIRFEESSPELDHAGDVDYVGFVKETKAFGIQIKPSTAKSNFGNYSVSERMKASFKDFQEDFGGKVFIVFSLAGEIANTAVIKDIEAEIARLSVL